MPEEAKKKRMDRQETLYNVSYNDFWASSSLLSPISPSLLAQLR